MNAVLAMRKLRREAVKRGVRLILPEKYIQMKRRQK